jgi:hypothetical protein
MKDQLDVTILAVLAAKHEISRLKENFASDDARLEPIDDAEMGTAWIIKRLRELEQSTGEEPGRRLVAETAAH